MAMTEQQAQLAKAKFLYFRVGNKVDNLPLYVRANTPQEARASVEQLIGPIPDKLITLREVKAEEIPEGEEILE